MIIEAKFATDSAHFAGTPDGDAAIDEYLTAREMGEDHDAAQMRASNLLQRRGYNVNARGGIRIDVFGA